MTCVTPASLFLWLQQDRECGVVQNFRFVHLFFGTQNIKQALHQTGGSLGMPSTG